MSNPESAAARIDSALDGFFQPRLKRGRRVCVGLSGGMDSVTLLHALWRLSRTGKLSVDVSAVHVCHGISPYADAWADFCREYCLRLNVPLVVAKVDVPRDSGEGLEGAARRLRHGVFAGLDVDWLVLAHHRDDQAETVLLNLLRGAGVAGASGMRIARTQVSGPVLARPFLGIARSVLLDYARAWGLSWIEDESNDDPRFRRNFLRHDILPRLEREFPGTGASLARAAEHFGEATVLLDALAALDRETVVAASGRIAVDAFNRLSPARARNLLRHVWKQAGHRAPDTNWVGEALKQLASADARSEICLTTADGALRVYRGELYIVPPHEMPVVPLSWSGQDALPWAEGWVRFSERMGRGIRRDMLLGKRVVLDIRRGGERLRPDARRPRRALRKLLRESAVPPWERARLPLLWIDGCLAWVDGIGCDIAFACPPGEVGIFPFREGKGQGSPGQLSPTASPEREREEEI
ncbi:MAG: tRNA lysidine(34) synthetase TilS [Candidatus Accumulibacter sp.]|jgi:tRNA(Ile)-lysidine synthase|nr:tRNA lysidine(34) synthetase TilS [Accumulibacter sp.]